jgi:hypothetical protein
MAQSVNDCAAAPNPRLISLVASKAAEIHQRSGSQRLSCVGGDWITSRCSPEMILLVQEPLSSDSSAALDLRKQDEGLLLVCGQRQAFLSHR